MVSGPGDNTMASAAAMKAVRVARSTGMGPGYSVRAHAARARTLERYPTKLNQFDGGESVFRAGLPSPKRSFGFAQAGAA